MANGIPIGSGGKKFPVITAADGNTVMVWEDDRNSGNDIYAQKLDADGAEQWLFGGVVISNAFSAQTAPRIVLDAQGGAIIAWNDSRNILGDIFAQHVKTDGTLGGASVVGSQTITFNPIAPKKFPDRTFNLNAIASSGLPVSYTSSNLSVATIEGNLVTITGVGNTTITANQAGNANYNAAPSVDQELTVIKGDQTITFNALPVKAPGDPTFTLGASASSDLPVSYASSNPAVATVSGTTVTIVGTGTSNITASQAGNVNFNAAASVIQPLTVKATQLITFTAVGDKTFGDPTFALSATSGAALPVTFTSASNKISISGNQVSILQAGSVSIKANQAGNDHFSAAPEVIQIFCIKPAKPLITVTGQDTPTPFMTSSAASGNQWYRNGTTIPGATNDNYTVIAGGSYTVVVSVDNCTSLAADEETFSIVTAVEDPAFAIKVYPNPIADAVIVDVSDWQGTTAIDLTLYDAFGHRLYHAPGNAVTTIPVVSYPAGIYLLKIQRGMQVIIKKLKK
jgi:hypothetical protein